MAENKSKILNTRIALRIDKETNWEKSTKPLMIGEIAMSYSEPKWSLDRKTYEYKDFKFKVGARDTDTGDLLTWNQLGEVSISNLNPDDKQAIINAVEAQIAGKYLLSTSFEEFKKTLKDQVVTGWYVAEEELFLKKELSTYLN